VPLQEARARILKKLLVVLIFLIRWKRRKTQLNLPKRSNIVFDYQRQIVFEIHLDLTAQVCALYEVTEIFKREFTLDDFAHVLLLDELHAAVRLSSTNFRSCEATCTPEYQLGAITCRNRLYLDLI
jgi:hypothetical protein